MNNHEAIVNALCVSAVGIGVGCGSGSISYGIVAFFLTFLALPMLGGARR